MSARVVLIAIVAGAAAAVGCSSAGRAPPAPVPSPSPVLPLTKETASAPCGGRGVRVVVTPPGRGDASATLFADFAGVNVVDSERVCLIRGDVSNLIEGSIEITVRAHPTEMQRLSVDDRAFLIRIRPDTSMVIHHHPCGHRWFLWAPWLFDASPSANRQWPHLRLAAGTPDVLMRGGDRSDAQTWPLSAAKPMMDFAMYGGSCPTFNSVNTATDSVRIALGWDEDCTVSVDAHGTVRGTCTPVPAPAP